LEVNVKFDIEESAKLTKPSRFSCRLLVGGRTGA